MRYLILFILLTGSVSCKKNAGAPAVTLNETATPNAISQRIGYFENGPYGQVSGKVSINKITEGNYELVLDSFMSSNGPDLYVYLSKEKMPVNFLEAGKLKSTNGKQVYPVSEADISAYKYICIHCKAYNHLFGVAAIK